MSRFAEIPVSSTPLIGFAHVVPTCGRQGLAKKSTYALQAELRAKFRLIRRRKGVVPVDLRETHPVRLVRLTSFPSQQRCCGAIRCRIVLHWPMHPPIKSSPDHGRTGNAVSVATDIRLTMDTYRGKSFN